MFELFIYFISTIKNYFFKKKYDIPFLYSIHSYGYNEDTILKMSNSKRSIRLSNFVNYDNLIINLQQFYDIYTSMSSRKKGAHDIINTMIWKISITKDGIINYSKSKLISDLYNTDDDNSSSVVFYIDSRTLAYEKFNQWLRLFYHMNYNLYDKFNNRMLDDFGIDLSSESVELESRNHNHFDIKLSRLQLATKNLELNTDYYLIRQILDSFYIITSIDRLFLIDDDESNYMICTKEQIVENILPPTECFEAVS